MEAPQELLAALAAHGEKLAAELRALGHPGRSLRCPRPPEPSDPAARAPIRTSAPYSAADASGSSCAAGARLR